ncbi:hypothetical protein F4859DRAFT_174833 [Xylaria cf. heliscus]|nr:hypothetical protein F4859DRAFT_174833 [Xylaria cf. heliscus]
MSSEYSPRTLYDVLDVSPDADVAAIEKAFKKMSLLHHPDKANLATRPKNGVESPREKEAREKRNNDRYIKIVQARDTLVDSQKRRAYDAEQSTKEPSADADKKTKDRSEHGSPKRKSTSRSSKSKSKSDSKSRPKSKSESKRRSTATHHDDEEFVLDIIESQIISLRTKLAQLEYMEREAQGLLASLEAATQRPLPGPGYRPIVDVLDDIFRRIRSASEDIYDALHDIMGLRHSSLDPSTIRSRISQVHDFAMNGAALYADQDAVRLGMLRVDIDQLHHLAAATYGRPMWR